MKKTISIILAILMIVTTIPFAFAAEDTPDFSDAKILTVNDEGVLCIDGVAVVCKNLGYNVTEQYIPDGKYKLASDISTLYYNTLFHTDAGSDVEIDLNGYTWSSKKFVLYVQGSLSIYDTSAENTGKIISTDTNGGILTYNGAREINLYNGTLENIDISVSRDNCVVNLYGGKIKCDTNALICYMEYSSIINIYDTVLETSDGVAHIDASIYDTDVAKTVINVADYSGDGLTIDAWIDIAGKFMLLEGIENSEEAEKYTVNYYSEFGNCFLEKTEYDETTGELYVYVVANEFTQQPSAENDYTVDFNNTNATFKWYEVEETVLTPDNVTAIDEVIFENEKWLHGGWYVELFTVDVQAGDIITASTTSARSFDLNVFTEDYSINEYVRATGKASVTIDSDAEVIVGIDVDVPNETTEFEIELIRTSELDETETDKTLQNPECGKTYVCKATVGENDYVSDVVTVGHNIVSVDAKAPTCSAAGYEAYEYCTACDYTTYEELPKEIFHKDADKNNKCDDCSAELAFEINRNGELLYYDNPYIQGFQALYDAAQDGDVITLLRDVFAYTIEIRKELTYDLNGFNIITASSRSINIYDNVTIRDSVGGGEIHLAVYIGAPCTIEGGMFYSLGVDSGITLDSILSPCAGYYDYKGNAIDTTGKTSIDNAYVIENHTEGDIYNCLGYKCAVCDKYYGEPNPDGHAYTEGVCDLCGYYCPHTETYETVTENEVAPKCDVAGSYDLVVYCACGEELDRDTFTVEALKHSFTKYEVTEEAKCGVEGKEVAYCDNGCGETDEKAIEALTHKDEDGDYICDNGCGHEFEKPAPEEPSDDVCEVCGRPVHEGETNEFICLILTFFKLLYTFIMAIK